MQVPSDPFLAFLDTRPEPGFPDLLTTKSDLGDFGVSPADEGQLREARVLRDRLVEAVLRSETGVQRRRRLDAMVREYLLVPDVAAPPGVTGEVYSVLAETRVAELASRMLSRAVDLERRGHLRHVKVCAADQCVVPFIDTTPSQRRCFCSPTCATRTRVRRHRQS